MNINPTSMKNKRILLLPLLLIGGLVWAQGPITTAVPFLSVAPDARGSGLANCGVASEADVFSMYYNPAKYAFIQKNTSVGISYSRWLIGKNNLFHAAASQRIGKRSVMAASFRYNEEMSISYYTPIGAAVGSYVPHHIAADLAYAFQLNDMLSIAVTGRYIRSSAFSTEEDFINTHDHIQTGQSLAFDLGVYYHKPVKLGELPAQYTLGASVTNVGNKIGYGKNGMGWNHYELIKIPIPTTLRVGTGLKMNLHEDHSLAGMIDFTKLLVPSSITYESYNESVFKGIIRSFYDAPGGFKEELYEINYGLGLEYAWKDRVYVRSGYFNQPQLKGNRKYLAFGIGFKFDYFGLDASYNLSTTTIHNSDYLRIGTYFNL